MTDGSAGSLDADQRIARLEDPAVHQGAHRLFRRLLQSIPKIGGLGIAVGVFLQIKPDAVAKLCRAQILLQHAQHRSALFVGEHVEHAGRLFGSLDRKLDGPGALETIDLHGRGARHRETIPTAPLRLPGVHREHFHEGRERFVQPQPIPPLHRHQIAKPHMGIFMGHDVGDALELGTGGFFGIDQQRGFAKGDGAQDSPWRPRRNRGWR